MCSDTRRIVTLVIAICNTIYAFVTNECKLFVKSISNIIYIYVTNEYKLLLISISNIIYTYVTNECKLFRFNVFSGSRCTDDFDGCEDNPCTVGTSCTDLTPAEHVTQGRAYVCTDCPSGYVDDDGTCVGSCERISFRLSTSTI